MNIYNIMCYAITFTKTVPPRSESPSNVVFGLIKYWHSIDQVPAPARCAGVRTLDINTLKVQVDNLIR